MRKILIMLTLLSVMITSTADSIKMNENSPILYEEKKQESNEISSLTTIEVYKLLYENTKETNDKIVNLVEWVIGISIAFLLAIISAQIFFNWKLNKKEIDNINNSIEEKMLALKTELIKSIDSKSNEIQNILNRKISETENQLKSDIKENFESRIKFFNLKSNAVESRFENELKQIRIELEKNSGDIWLLRGVESNALSSYLNTAFLQIELKRELKYILEDIISILSKIDEIHKSDYDLLEKLMSELKPELIAKKETIESLYKTKPVYHYVERRGFYQSSGLSASMLGLGTFMTGRRGGISSSFPIKEYIRNKPQRD